MGIAGFYRHLIEQFPYLSDALAALANQDKIFLYFDFNGMIHPCSHKVLARYENKDPKTIDRRALELEIFQEIRKQTLAIVKKIKPTFLFVAVDGVAPRAKMTQQRTRRYNSVIEKRELRKIFDSNSISPGTLFMKRLTEFMKNLRLSTSLRTTNIVIK